jgi:hypothetical protein
VTVPFDSLGLFRIENRADTALGHHLPAQHTICMFPFIPPSNHRDILFSSSHWSFFLSPGNAGCQRSVSRTIPGL